MVNGSVPDDIIYQNSSLFNKMKSFEIPFQLVSDQTWLLSDYKGELTEEQTKFNEAINKLQIKGEKTLTRFKGRWRILTKKFELKKYLIPNLLKASCILHNFLENREEYLIDWDFHSISCPDDGPITWNSQNNEVNSVRENLMNFLNTN